MEIIFADTRDGPLFRALEKNKMAAYQDDKQKLYYRTWSLYQGHICLLLKLVCSIWNTSGIVNYLWTCNRLHSPLVHKKWCHINMTPWTITRGAFKTNEIVVKNSEKSVKWKAKGIMAKGETRIVQHQRSRRVGQALQPMGRMRFITFVLIGNHVVSWVTKVPTHL